MNLAFFTNILADVHYQAQVLLQRSITLGKLVNTHTKGITLLCIGKNNNLYQLRFNDVKYIFEIYYF